MSSNSEMVETESYHGCTDPTGLARVGGPEQRSGILKSIPP